MKEYEMQCRECKHIFLKMDYKPTSLKLDLICPRCDRHIKHKCEIMTMEYEHPTCGK